MNLSPALVKVVELSNSHLREEDTKLLELLAEEHRSAIKGTEGFAPVVLETRYGFVIPIGELTVQGLVERGASAELKSLLDWCLDPAQGVVYLAFDADASEMDELPVFEW